MRQRKYWHGSGKLGGRKGRGVGVGRGAGGGGTDRQSGAVSWGLLEKREERIFYFTLSYLDTYIKA